MASFHPFPRLPYELRARIWEMTVQPRTVDVEVRHRDYQERVGKFLTSSTPPPAVLRVCREARNSGLYQKCFAELSNPSKGLQYVWLNLDIDIVDIGESRLRDFKPVAESVYYLRLEREWSASYHGEIFYHWENEELRQFVNVKAIYFVCADGLYAWEGMLDDAGAICPCGEENVFFIDPEDGERVFRGPEGLEQIHEMWEQEMREKELQEQELQEQELSDIVD